jgi:hypothetical protein
VQVCGYRPRPFAALTAWRALHALRVRSGTVSVAGPVDSEQAREYLAQLAAATGLASIDDARAFLAKHAPAE